MPCTELSVKPNAEEQGRVHVRTRSRGPKALPLKPAHCISEHTWAIQTLKSIADTLKVKIEDLVRGI